MPYDISEQKRAWYRAVSARSRQRKNAAENGELSCAQPQQLNVPVLQADGLMPQLKPNGFRALSLFSGGGGLDLGFERAGFTHVASFDVLEICGATLRRSRPSWRILSGPEGDVARADWRSFVGEVDVIHGGPPCQPFSIAGKRNGAGDDRDMWPAFIRAVLAIKPLAFVAENVPGLLSSRFAGYVDEFILKPLSGRYDILKFRLSAASFGVPQDRQRVIFVGIKTGIRARYQIPAPTHGHTDDLFSSALCTPGARAALGLPDIGFDCHAPTLRSGFTGPRKTTSILNSKASLATWGRLRIWPNGVQKNRQAAVAFPPENDHFRLSVQDCAVLQGFPDDWRFEGAVDQVLGQIGNSVCPPVGYVIAKSLAEALRA